MQPLMQDVRFALRTLGRSRGYTVVAVLCLALGIGVNTAVFSLVNAILLRPFPFEAPERVVSIHASDPRRAIDEYPLSAADYLDWTAGTTTLTATAALDETVFALSSAGGEPERVHGLGVTPNLFRLLGLAPALGRDFTLEEGRPGGAPVVLLSHALWQRRYGGDPGVVGQTVDLDGRPHTVVGVMAEGMRFPETALLWVARQPDRTEPRSQRYLWVMGRLAPGATVEQAQAELDAVARRLGERFPQTNAGWRARVLTFQDYMVDGPLRPLLVLMLGAVGCVLLIACANVANLLLARATARRRELVVRAALGAGRARLVRQLLTESVLVALAGGGLGILVAVWWNDAMLAWIPEELPYWLRVDVDARVLLYTLGISVLTGLVFGALPAIRASRPDLHHVLKDGARGSAGGGAGQRLRDVLVGGQIALSVVLLVAAALMTRSFLNVRRADPGFDAAPLLTARAYMAGQRYDSVAVRAAFLARAVDELGALPGVQAVAATTAIPTDDGGPSTPLVLDGRPVAPGEELIVTTYGSTPGLFDALGVALLAGRPFTSEEAADPAARVVILGRTLAEQLWPGGEAIGRRVRLPLVDSVASFTVVGVAPEIVYEEFGEVTAQSRRQVHLPYARTPYRFMALLVRGPADPRLLAAGVRQTMRTLDPTLPTFDVRTMAEVRHVTSWSWRLFGQVFGTFGVLALFLAAIGVYGVMAYAVSQRVHEIGIRMALGADAGSVRRLVLGRGVVVTLVGTVVGIGGALLAARAMTALLFGVGAADPLSFVVVPLVLAAVALLACWLPARRATLIDPLVALRSE
jgi:putative ABC transport system permease protein